MDLFSPKSCRIVSFLLLSANKRLSQKEIVANTSVSKGFVSKAMAELIKQGFVSRPYRSRFILDEPNKLLLAWAAHRNIRSNEAYFAPSKRALRGVRHAHTLFSGAWLDARYLKTRFTTVYVEPAFRSNLPQGTVSELKDRVILIVAPDEHVFYGSRKVRGKGVVSPQQLYVDLASFGGIAETAQDRLAEKYGFPKAR